MFASPVAEAELAEDIVFNYHIPSSVKVDPDSVVSLVIWNPGMCTEWYCL